MHISQVVTTHRSRPSQLQRVRALLLEGWVCATEFLYLRIPRFSSVIHVLRKQGVRIERRICEDDSHHHQSRQYQWRAEDK